VEEYLPPIVTKLKADLSDLVRGLAEARAMVRDFAAGSHKELVDAMTDAGRDGGAIFGNEFRKSSSRLLHDMDRDIGNTVRDESRKIMSSAGADSGRAFSGSFTGMMWPLLIGALVLLAPAIVTLVAGAIATGVSLGFVGLGVFLLRQQPALIAAAISFKNTISQVFKDAAAPMLGPLIKALQILEGTVRAMAPFLNQIFASLATVIEPLAQGLSGFFLAMMPGLTEMIGHTEIVKEFAYGLVEVGKGLGDMFHQIATHGPEIAAFMRDFMTGVGNLIRFIGDLIAVMSVAYVKISEFHSAAKAGGWDTPWGAWLASLNLLAAGVVAAFGAIGSFIGGLWQKVSPAVESGLNKAGAFIGSWTDRILGYFASIPGRVWRAVQALPKVLGEAAETAFDAFFYWTSYGITRTLALIGEFPENLRHILVVAWIYARDAFTSGVDSVENTARTLPGRVIAWFDNLAARIFTWSEKTYWALVHWAYDVVSGVLSWLNTLPERAGNALESLWKKIKEGINDAKSWMKEAGANLLHSLVNGFTDAVESGINIVKRAIERIKEGARDALGLHSPSKVFEEMGRFSMLGYIKGVWGTRGMLGDLWGKLQVPQLASGSMVAMAGAAASGGSAGAGYSGPGMVHTTVQIDGTTVVEAITPAAQQRKLRTGTTGLS
jgi:hypothetical protein